MQRKKGSQRSTEEVPTWQLPPKGTEEKTTRSGDSWRGAKVGGPRARGRGRRLLMWGLGMGLAGVLGTPVEGSTRLAWL